MPESCKECTLPSKINKVLYILLGFAVIFLFSAILNDETGLGAKHKIRLPVFGVELESSKIFEIGPIIIIFMALCLHVFVQLWYHCDKNEHDKEICLSRVDFITGNLVREALFFGLAPFVLFLFHINSRGKSDHLLTGIYFLTGTFFLLYLRLLYGYTRKKSYSLIAVPIIYIVLIAGFYNYQNELDIVRVYPLDLRGADLSGQLLFKANFENMKAEAAHFENSNLFRQNLQGAVSPHAIFNDANLFAATFRYADFGSARFANADLGQATFDNAEFTCAVLTKACLENSKIMESSFVAANLNEARISGSEIIKSNFQYASLEKAKLNNTKILLSDFNGTNLKGAEFNNATIKLADMNGAQLSGSDFFEAELEGVDLSNADLSGAKNLEPDQLKGVCGNRYTKIRNIKIENKNKTIANIKIKDCPKFYEFLQTLHRTESYY